ncbi:MAG: 1-acyl-sn-glycerol-3-phosphate acyltransferase [Clostridiales bacterium]|nr:1-acyl-sn-glycerol-3-phosphate acyltransferase [Candidatus Blautia equi]
MKRILLMVFRNLIFVPFAWIKLCWYAGHVERYTEEQKYDILRMITDHAVRSGNITIDAHGVENIPSESGYMFYPNHQGMFDMLAIIHSNEKPLSAIVKKEAAGVPFLKQVIALMKGFAIDREDIRQSMEVIIKVTKEVKAGRNYVIFAEGTRSRNGNHLLEFKGGSFKAATKAKCPIIPVALIDSYKAFDTGSIAQITVQVHYLPPMLYEEYKDMKTVEIAAEVKRRIEETIREYDTAA